MQIKRIESNWPYERKASRLEQSILSIIETNARKQLSIQRLMILSVTLTGVDIKKEIEEFKPEFIICHSLVDPIDDTLPIILEQSGIPYTIIGNSNDYRIDFWAMAVYLFFSNYKDHELNVTSTAKKYLCYNRKPHYHRIDFVKQLQEYVPDLGYISLGLPGDNAILVGDPIVREEVQPEWPDALISDKITNDVFSLGDPVIWNNAYLCLVTETMFKMPDPESFFISEKTWKPIIGLRPFFVYGQPKLRLYLKENGFDIFEDIFDYSSVNENSNTIDYSRVAINAINNIQDPQQDFYQIRHRLINNKNRFYEYALEQWAKLDNINLTELYGKARI